MGRQVAPQPSFQDALLQPAKGGPDITAKELWANKPVVFLLIRRPGCVMCRAEARRFWSLRDSIEAAGCTPVCLLHEMLPAEVKVFHPTFWGGELYLDKQRLMYKELGNGKERRSGWFWLLFTSFISLPRRSRAMKYLGPDASESYEGEMFTMGGYLVADKTRGVVWRWKEKVFGDQVPKDALLQACREASDPSAQKGKGKRK